MSLAFDRDTYGKLLAEYQPQVINSEDEYEGMLADAERLNGIVFNQIISCRNTPYNLRSKKISVGCVTVRIS